MNIDLISVLVFYGIILLLFFKYRDKFDVQNKIFVLYRTKLGLKLMDNIAKRFPRLLGAVAYISIATGIAGMLFIFYFLIKETMKFIVVPGTQPPLAPVLPGVAIPGAPALSFWHWILAIFFVAMVHEFSHGTFARLYKIRVKSSGFAFLGPILAAFVEPDEKQISKASLKKQLAVFSAGPFANIVWGIIFFALLVFVMAPAQQAMFVPGGIMVGTVIEGYPLEAKGIEAPFVIRSVNGKDVIGAQRFMEVFEGIGPGEEVLIETDKGYYGVLTVPNPQNASRGMIGIEDFSLKLELRESLQGHDWIITVFLWTGLLVSWLFIINIGVGLFNLLPLGPVDGGKMLYTITCHYIKNKKKATKIWLFITYISLILLIINLLPWLWKFIVFIAGKFALLAAIV